MAIVKEIKSIKDVDWKFEHSIPEEETSFQEFIKNGQIAIGDKVTIENTNECVFNLPKGYYCLTFNKGNFFIEEPFTLNECKLLFGEDFDY